MLSRPAVGYVLAAFCLVVLGLTFFSFFGPVQSTSFGVHMFDTAGSNGRLTGVDPTSGAYKDGLRAGDVVDLGALTLSQRYRLQVNRSPAGTPLTLHIVSRGKPRTVTLYAQTAPSATTADFIAATLINAVITLLIVALVVARRPSLGTAALVLYALGAPQSFAVAGVFSWIADPFFGPLAALLNLFIALLPVWALLPFLVRFPEEPRTASGRTAMRIAGALYLLAVVALGIEAFYEPVLFISWGAFNACANYGGVAAIVVFAALAYARTAGEQRRRVGWVLVGVVIAAIAYTTFDIVDLLRPSPAVQATLDVTLVMQSTLPIALGYAILRHRVLDIGFALNRTMVYGIITALVVIVVSFVDWLTTRMLSETRLALAVEALVTIGFGVALNWIHKRTEHVVDRIVFRARYVAEKRIEYRIGALDFAQTDAFVDETVAIEAPRILDLQSAAVFRRTARGDVFVRTAASGWSSSERDAIEDDSLLVTTLRSLERPIVLDDVAIHDAAFPHGELRPALAIPIVSQHELAGFALFGNHRDNALPDPEEMNLLARLCHAAGNGYAMVEIRRWREHAGALERAMPAL